MPCSSPEKCRIDRGDPVNAMAQVRARMAAEDGKQQQPRTKQWSNLQRTMSRTAPSGVTE
jgi:hypothetical protein